MAWQVSGDKGAVAFLDACLRGRWDPLALQEVCATEGKKEIDWQAFLRVAHDGGVAPVLYSLLRGRGWMPTEVEADLRLAYHHTLARNLALFGELKRLLGCLAAEAVPVILLKGAALAEGVYGNLALRPMGDLDLLVQPEDAPAALRTLARAGYEPVYAEYRLGYALTYRNNVELVKPGAESVRVELHWRLLSPIHYQRVMESAWWWQTALPAKAAGAEARTLGPEAQILYLCGHILQHGDPRVARTVWLLDVAEAARHYDRQIDWDKLLSQAQAHDLLLAVRGVLRQVTRRWSVPISPGVLKQIDALRPSDREERAYAWLTVAPGAVRYIWAEATSISGWRARLWFLWCNLWPSSDYMRRQYNVRHSALLPWYHVRRWTRILKLIR